MTRDQFIKLSSLAGLSLAIAPQLSFSSLMDDFSRNQLIGKGNSDIVGNSYRSKMHKDAKKAFDKMKAAAAKESINLEVVSAYRSFQRQKEIFERKYKNFTSSGMSPEDAIEKIIEYSTIPGTSRHHWGTDLDIIDANRPRPADPLLQEHFHGNGSYCNMKMWMDENSEKFGFFEAYTNNGNRKGFKYEPWHFSYAPISIPMLKSYQSKIDVKKMLSDEKIIGSEHFSDAFISRYIEENIMDINPKLLP
ncbi:MAG TPA: M15 family metallopeptidase [Aequorivita sp.]|nr:M15 family metallopeptidase [Aequorivita sp.]